MQTQINILTDSLIDRGLLPDFILRGYFKKELANLLVREARYFNESYKTQRLNALKKKPMVNIADLTVHDADWLSSAYKEPFLKHNSGGFCGLSLNKCENIADMKQAMLQLICSRADIQDGQHILELGNGSVSLFIAEHFKKTKITLVSDSAVQVDYIRKKAARKKLKNIQSMNAEVNEFTANKSYDRIIGTEVFGRLINYELFLKHIRSCLKDTGKLFAHMVVHEALLYPLEYNNTGWLNRHFSTSGMMPCQDIFKYFTDDLQVEKVWRVNGLHGHKTCEAKLEQYKKDQTDILRILGKSLPENIDPITVFNRQRALFMAYSEMFRYRKGTEWFITHQLLKPVNTSSIPPKGR